MVPTHPLDELIAELCRDEEEMTAKVALAFWEAFGEPEEGRQVLAATLDACRGNDREFWEEVTDAFDQLRSSHDDDVPGDRRD